MERTKRKYKSTRAITLAYSDKISEQEEILRAAQKLKDEVLRKLLEDFNSVDEDPMNGEQLAMCLHKRGVNIRQIGRICTSVRSICNSLGYRLI